jgi:hypothetical protein
MTAWQIKSCPFKTMAMRMGLGAVVILSVSSKQ